jgi:hypothetical protein
LYKDKLIVGYGQQGETSYYPNWFVLFHLFNNNQLFFCK